MDINGDVYENEEKYSEYEDLLNHEIIEYQTNEKFVTDDLCPIGI